MKATRFSMLVSAALIALTPCITSSMMDQDRGSSLRRHVEYLASRELGGRVPVSKGDTLARAYIASQFSALGLQPLVGESYFQYFPILYRIESGVEPELEIALESGDTVSFDHMDDYVADARGGSGTARGEAAFIGYGIHAPDLGYSDFDAIDLEGKVVFCFLLAPRDSAVIDIRTLALSHRFFEKVEMAHSRGAIAFIYVLPDREGQLRSSTEPYRDRIPGQYMRQQEIPVLRIEHDAFSRLLDCAGLSISNIEKEILCSRTSRAFSIPGSSVHLSSDVRYVYSAACNVLSYLEGADSRETILIGAHYDHIGRNRKGRLRLGANDNASGVAVMIELAALLSRTVPKCNYIFAAFGMEEWGCVGSRYIVENVPDCIENTKAMINLDMVGRLRDDELYLFHTQSSREWMRYVSDANSADMRLVIMPNSSPTDSDPFNRAGIPTLSVYTGSDSIADHDNEIDELNFNGLAEILVFSYELLQSISHPDSSLSFQESNLLHE